MYITRSKNTDEYLYQFFDIKNLLCLTQINHQLYNSIHTLPIINQYLEYKTSEGTTCLIDFACEKNYVKLLDHIYNTNKFEYESYAIDLAVKNNCIDVLKWFKNKNLKIKFKRNYCLYLIINDNENLIEWLNNTEYSYEGYISDIKSSLLYHHVIKKLNVTQSLPYFYNFKFDFEVTSLVDSINLNFILDVVRYNYNLILHPHNIKHIMKNGNVNVLEWINQHYKNLIFGYIKYYMDIALKYNRWTIVEWLVSHYEIKNLNEIIQKIRTKNRPDIVKLLNKYIK